MPSKGFEKQDRKSVSIRARLTPALAAAFDQLRAEHGLSDSAMMRKLIEQASKNRRRTKAARKVAA